MGALNSAGIGERVKLKKFNFLYSSKISKVWKELKNDKNMSISRVWVVVDEN
jgi:hypothetical protein